MKQIPVKAYKSKKILYTLIDEEDYERIKHLKFWENPDQYIYTRWLNNGKDTKYFLHRLILNIDNKKIHIDHINHDKSDNRKSNLRICINQQNIFNKLPKKATSKYKGVSLCKHNKKWRAVIMKDYKQHWIGYFETEKEASIAYDKKAKKLFGNFAWLNTDHFPELLENQHS